MPVRDENGFELFDWDPATGRTVWQYFDGEKTVFRTDYPVDGLLKINAEQRAISSSSWAGDFHHVASVPLNVVYDSGLAEAQNQGDMAFTKRWLNDSDNRTWRTKEGTL